MLYRFTIELSDVDRNIYQTLEFRVAQHPSEIPIYLLTKVLAYVLSFEEGLEFSGSGLSDPDAPALKLTSPTGANLLWIEIGNPSAKKLHKANKNARKVVVYTYKSAEVLMEDIRTNDVYKAEEIEIFSIDSKFLAALEKQLDKNNRWSILHQQGNIDINTGKESFLTEVNKLMVKK